MNDFKAALLVMKSLDCFGFFNCGFDSGGSMNHKHIQFMPYSSVAARGLSGMIPLEKTAMYYYEKAGIKEQMFTLPQFSGFKHVFLKYEYDMLDFENDQGLLNINSSIMVENYLACHKYLHNEEIS